LLDLPAGSFEAKPAPAPTVPTVHDLRAWVGRYAQGGGSMEIAIKDGHLVCRVGARELRATPSGDLTLAVSSGDSGDPPATWSLVPDRDGKPGYVFRGGRAFKRVGP